MSNIILLSMLLVGVTAPSIHLYQSSSAKGETSKRMDALVRELSAGYAQGAALETRPLVAVFPFETDAELEKHRFGFATASLLTRRLMADLRFGVVRQSELSRIMREQGLGRDRAVDVETAVKVGKLLGASHLVLGSVTRHGKALQIWAQLIDVASGQALSTAHQEVSAVQFALVGHRYLAPIPPKRNIGLYYLYNYRYNQNHVPSFAYDPLISTGAGALNDYTSTVSPRPFHSRFLGIGLRYFPSSICMIDLSVAEKDGTNVIASDTAPPQMVLGNTVPERKAIISAGPIYLYRANVNWIHPLKYGLSGVVGAGASWYRADSINPKFSANLVPSIRGGLEYRRRSHWAITLLVNYDISSPQAKYGSNSLKLPEGVRAFEFDQLSFEPTLAFYF